VSIRISLAVEDDLSEAVIRRLLKDRPIPYDVLEVHKRGGAGYLRKRTKAFNNLARLNPVLLLTDLDRCPCPPGLLEEWLPHPRHRNFLLRVAVREVEAWLLADDDSMGRFLGLRRALRIPDPEGLPDPKAELLKLGNTSPIRDVRDGLVRLEHAGVLRQGPAYNSIMSAYVYQSWQAGHAVAKCRSLRRMVAALQRLESDLEGGRH